MFKMCSVDRFIEIYKNLIFDQNVGYNLFGRQPSICSLFHPRMILRLVRLMQGLFKDSKKGGKNKGFYFCFLNEVLCIQCIGSEVYCTEQKKKISIWINCRTLWNMNQIFNVDSVYTKISMRTLCVTNYQDKTEITQHFFIIQMLLDIRKSGVTPWESNNVQNRNFTRQKLNLSASGAVCFNHIFQVHIYMYI